MTDELHLCNEQIVYVGDKTDIGNDACLIEMGFKIFPVRDVADFNSFARTYLINKMKL